MFNLEKSSNPLISETKMSLWPDGFGGNNQLGFAKFKEKENPFTFFTPVGSSAGFGSNSSSTLSTTSHIPNPPPANNTTGNVVIGYASGLFGPTSSAVATQPSSPFGSCCESCDKLFCTHAPTNSLFSSQNSTCSSFHQPSNNPFSGSQTGGQHSSGCSPFSSGNSSTPPFGFGVEHFSSGSSSATTSPCFGTMSFGVSRISAFAPIGPRFGDSTTSSTGDQLFSTNPTTAGAALYSSQSSTCAFQQPSNSVPSSSLFSDPRPLFSSSKCSQSGGQLLSGWSPFSSGISSSPGVSQSGGQHSSGWSPFSSGISSLPAVSQSGGQNSSGWSPFSSGISSLPAVSHSSGWSPFSSGSPAVSQSVGQNSSGCSPFSSGISSSPGVFRSFSSTSPFGVQPFSSSSSATTLPFGTKLPFGGFVFGGSTTSSTGPLTRSLVQENNTSANNVSVFAPITRSNLGISDTQGTRVCSYAPTPEVFSGCNCILTSISAMPFYNEKSHEELRSEDYQLTGTTGGLVPTSISSSTGTISSFSFSNPSASDSLIPTSSLPLHHAVISIPLSIEIRHLGDLLATTQITIPVPTSGTLPAFNNATVTDSIITSLPEPVSTGGFTPGFRCSTDNRQTPVGHIFPANPIATEATVTLPTTTVQYGISGLTVYENAERRPPIEKYKADDEDVMAIIPTVKCPEYYTEPSIDDLAAKELKRPGFCCHVKDFVIGKRGYGSIKFLGETDVRNLDLESMVQFNICEVIFCMDNKKAKPPLGQGLNKAAEITLLNVNCIDKNTGKQYIDGPEVDKYKQLLVRRTVEQGAEFVSFDPAKGEWKFKVQHF